jgi:uncharacterized membrane protein
MICAAWSACALKIGALHSLPVQRDKGVQAVALRSVRERCYQTLAYELGGVLIAAPLYALVFSKSVEASFLLIASISVCVMARSPIHNILFDWVDLLLSGRVASDRPHGLRLIHAVSLEVTSTLVSLPIIMWMGGIGFWPALGVDIGLTVLYTAYAYAFHLVYDWLRPIARRPEAVWKRMR